MPIRFIRLPLVLGAFLFLTAPAPAADPMIVMDGHVDILLRLIDPTSDRRLDEPGFAGQANFENWRAGGMNAIFFAVWIDPRRYPKERAVERADALIDCFYEQVQKYPDRLAFCETAADVRRVVKEGRVAGLMGIEGGSAINNDIRHIQRFRKRGVRYMTLTWRGNLQWAGSSQDVGNSPWDRQAQRRGGADATPEPEDNLSSGGLTDFGREIVGEMNRVGMIVDLSHVSDQTFYDAIAATRRPVILSHSNASARAPHPRNISDDMLRALAKNGGVIGLNLWTDLLDPAGQEAEKKTSVTLEMTADMVDHMVKVAGIDSVGIGTDFEGMSSLPVGLENASRMQDLFTELRKRGYLQNDLRKFAGENFLRVLEANDRPWAPEMEAQPAAKP